MVRVEAQGSFASWMWLLEALELKIRTWGAHRKDPTGLGPRNSPHTHCVWAAVHPPADWWSPVCREV